MNTTHTTPHQNGRGGAIAGRQVQTYQLRPARPANGRWIGRRQSQAATLSQISAALAELRRTPLEPRKAAVEAQTPAGTVEAVLEAAVPAARDHMPAVLGMLAAISARGGHVSPLAKSWTRAAKLLPQELGYPDGLPEDELNALLASAEDAGILGRGSFTDSYRKRRPCWVLTASGKALAATLPQTAAADLDAEVVPVAQGAEVAQDVSTAREADVLAALAQASEETGVAHREDWLESIPGPCRHQAFAVKRCCATT
jgi:hypothetical protein